MINAISSVVTTVLWFKENAVTRSQTTKNHSKAAVANIRTSDRIVFFNRILKSYTKVAGLTPVVEALDRMDLAGSM